MSSQHQIAVLINSHSYDQICQTYPAEGRVLASLINMREHLRIVHKNLSQVLRSSQDLSDSPLFRTMVDLERQIDEITQTIDAVVKDTLYDSLGISEDLTVIEHDLELHNAPNPHHQIIIAQLKNLEAMSDRHSSP